MSPTRLQQIVALLKKRHGAQKPPVPGREPLHFLYFEAVGYLGTDEARVAAFAVLRDRVGLEPRSVLKAPLPVLAAICRIGGIFHEKRAERLKEVSALVVDEFGGDLASVLSWDFPAARRALQKFPGIGEPGAERILMLCGLPGVLGFLSNEQRTLNRLGYGEELKNYTKSYRLTRDAALAELPSRNAALVQAALLLRRHGQVTCKASAPRCEECPLTLHCAWFAAHSR